MGKQAPARLQLREFLQVAAGVVGQPLLEHAELPGWREALQVAVGSWSRPEKLVLALDEFQWIVQESPELPSILQELWDRDWSRTGRIMLIVSGSYVGFMEREVLGRKSPLFGRRTAQLHLKPFGYSEARLFHPDYSLVDSARVYFVCGGVPQYLKCFDPAASIDSNLSRQVLEEFSPLHNEPDFLLREELRDVHNYYALLSALATASARIPELARVTTLPERSVPYYLQQLVELGYLRRLSPLVAGPRAPRKVRFALDDPLLRFWFRFVFPNRSQIAALGPDRAFHQLVKPHLPAYFGRCFEGLCREALAGLYAREGITAAWEIGEYWDKTTQIDVVGLREDNWTDLGECRWGRSPGLVAAATELERKVNAYPNARNATIGRRLFVGRKEPGRLPAGVRVHDLEDLYSN
ncbi:MAG: ATPase AAA [Candidatus Xenobia bacterium]